MADSDPKDLKLKTPWGEFSTRATAVAAIVAACVTGYNSCGGAKDSKLDDLKQSIAEVKQAQREMLTDQQNKQQNTNKQLEDIRNSLLVLQYGKQDKPK